MRDSGNGIWLPSLSGRPSVPLVAVGAGVGMCLGLAGVLMLHGGGTAAAVLVTIEVLTLAAVYWSLVSIRRLHRDRNALSGQVALAEARHQELMSDSQQQIERWKREAQELDRRNSAIQDWLLRYEHALSAIASRSSRVVYHRLASITYEIGESADGDRVTESYSTVAADVDRPLLWCDVRVGLRGTGIPPLRSFRSLEDLQAHQTIDGRRYPLEPLAAGQVGARYRALVLFEPVIGDQPREWTWSYRWPLWNPLRQSNKDSLGFEVFNTMRYDLLEIHVVFPRTAIDPVMLPRESRNVYLPSLDRDPQGRLTITVRLTKPEPDHYSWTLSVGGFTDRAD